MSQTFAPGTILSVGGGPTLEQVIVMTDGKVATKTFAGKPVERRDIMSMADWRLLIGDQRIQFDYLPISSGAEPVAAPAPAPESYPVGTKLNWTHNGDASRWYNPNSRTAIVLKDGILQVKETIHGVPTMTQTPGADYQRVARKFFSSLADWKMTLPADGTITVTVATDDFSLPSIQRKAVKPIVAETDVGYIAELQERYTVLAKLEEGFTPLEQRSNSIERMGYTSDCINDLMRSRAVTNMDSASCGDAYDTMGSLARLGKRLARQACKMQAIQLAIRNSPEKANVKPITFTNNYRQRIVAFVGGREVEIASCKKLGLLGVAWDREQDAIGKWFKPTTGKTFAELGIDCKADGKPLLKVYYRKDTINI
jgi:hypothetical protein